MLHLCMWILSLVLIWNPVHSQYEGEACENNSGLGVCQLLSNCPRAQNRAVLRTLRTCGFDGSDPIVCCPGLESRYTNEGQYERVASRECRRMSSEVPTSMVFLITGGVEASQNEFPHMAALGYQQLTEAQANPTNVRFSCGGTLISRRYVLTAAHCINTRQGSLTTVRMGELALTNYTEVSDFGVERTIVHPNYNSRFNYNDIALIRLNRDVRYTMSMYPACLHNDSSEITSGMTITGWGITDPNRVNSASRVLLKATVSAMNIPQCDTFYQTLRRRIPQGLNNGQICAVNQTADTCQGDSGGPLQIKHPEFDIYSIVGVTSFGRNCGSNIPAVYTKVAEYLDWIESQVWPQS